VLSAGPIQTAARPSSSQAEPVQLPPEQVLVAWNDALNRHDIEALARFYGPQVRFYGQSKTSTDVAALKQTALTKQPNFRQRIDHLRVNRDGARVVIEFEKWSGPTLGSQASGRVAFETVDGKFLIVEETDAPTEQRWGKHRSESCSDVAFDIAAVQETIIADRERVAREMPNARPGGITYEESAKSLDAAVGYFLPERFETRWSVRVEQGVLIIQDTLTQHNLSVTPWQRARVQAACK